MRKLPKNVTSHCLVCAILTKACEHLCDGAVIKFLGSFLITFFELFRHCFRCAACVAIHGTRVQHNVD